ncbi:hypothetical protein PtA15_10A602 [Puccinia triticina]|uniref:Uncharacterized protein n=1 Tax=Puccinia triticina TaxID=208348 RepID=A0ABY7CW74_9BASI|nr:uncharacterized protein PtA15_10A602 [Puccinia triticina]WAQ89178.1 hypothetical protein PtA15_10A602 [Puccinia triticina]
MSSKILLYQGFLVLVMVTATSPSIVARVAPSPSFTKVPWNPASSANIGRHVLPKHIVYARTGSKEGEHLVEGRGSASPTHVTRTIDINEGGWTTDSPANIARDELPAHQVDGLKWSRTIKHVVEGRGSLLGRDEESKEKLALAHQAYPTIQKAGDYIKSKLGWTGSKPETDKNLWEEGVYNNRLYAQFHLNEYPYALPPKVTHWVYWIRVSPVNEESFRPLAHESVPHSDYLDPVRVAALTRYVNHYDLYGWSGIPERIIRTHRPSSFAHPTDHVVWKDPVSGEEVTRLQGARAIQWAGRHVCKAIQSQFPPDDYQVLFNRAPERWKSVVEPDHVQYVNE